MSPKLFLLSLLFVGTLSAQRYTEYDTIHRTEVSASFLPLFTALSGYEPAGRYGSWNFGYKRYFKNYLVFRTAIVIGHEWNMSSPYDSPTYDTTLGQYNYFIEGSQY